MHHVIIYSGGMDSYTLLHYVIKIRGLSECDRVHALSFDYGQRHRKELDCAVRECQRFHIPHDIIDLRSITRLLKGSALTDDIEVPEGHYEAESMKQTVVPGRNTLMLSIALAKAQSLIMTSHEKRLGMATIYFGAHVGDHHIYPDCRHEYVKALSWAFELATEMDLVLCAPFIHDTKISILTRGLQMGLDYANTWTCYKGQEEPCGKCGACQERAEAFAKNGVADPTLSKSLHVD